MLNMQVRRSTVTLRIIRPNPTVIAAPPPASPGACSPMLYARHIWLSASSAARPGESLIVLLQLVRRAIHLRNVRMGVLLLHGELVHGYPGSCIHLRVVNSHSQLQAIVVHAVP